ncbi:hypothetical protein [Chitinophaga sp. CB10]|uniref:hypothetical protein n=1 Tax=Chitinophaga sp. CB10 TaxID=1891659 RepID=UPI0025BC5ECF|nr:hypothetical protein [Chitinophaga sp. CB10]
MRVAIFFACLSFFLFKGDDRAYAACRLHSFWSVTLKNLQHKQLTKLNPSIIQDSSLEEEEKLMMTDDVESDSCSTFVARKYRLIASFYLSLASFFEERDLHKCYHTPPPDWGQLSNIYITQRVLRI